MAKDVGEPTRAQSSQDIFCLRIEEVGLLTIIFLQQINFFLSEFKIPPMSIGPQLQLIQQLVLGAATSNLKACGSNDTLNHREVVTNISYLYNNSFI